MEGLLSTAPTPSSLINDAGDCRSPLGKVNLKIINQFSEESTAIRLVFTPHCRSKPLCKFLKAIQKNFPIFSVGQSNVEMAVTDCTKYFLPC